MKTMAKKIFWETPDDNSITRVEISKSDSQYGSYVVASTLIVSSTAWTTNYTDSTGLRTDWYKIRFSDGTNYTDYSEPVTSESNNLLCSIDDVKAVIDTVGRFTDDEVYDAIKETTEIIYMECGTPLAGIVSGIGKIDNTVQDLYYVGEENIYKVDRVFYGTTTKTELFLDDKFQVNELYGMVKLITTGTYAITLDTTCDVEIRYVPKIFNKLCSYRTAQSLLEGLDSTSGGKISKELQVINKNVDTIETILAHRVGVQLSSDMKYYDPKYGVNTRYFAQDHYRNRYISSTGIGGW